MVDPCTVAESSLVRESLVKLFQRVISQSNNGGRKYLCRVGAGLVDLELARLLLNPKRFLNPGRTFSPGSSDALDMRWADFFRNRGMLNELLVCVVDLIKWFGMLVCCNAGVERGRSVGGVVRCG